MEITSEFYERIISLNKNAMGIMNMNEFGSSVKMLKNALSLLDLANDSELKHKLLAITQNNLGCVYKKRKKPKTALDYLKLASENERKAEIDLLNRASTFLNICAIFSSLGKHKKALEQSLKALEMLRNIEKSENFYSTLVIAYHNTAVEYEYLKEFRSALEYYQLAFETALKRLGSGHPLTESTGRDYKIAEQIIQDHEIQEVVKDIDREMVMKNILPKQAKNKKYRTKFDMLKEFPYLSSKKVKEIKKRNSVCEGPIKPFLSKEPNDEFIAVMNNSNRTNSVSLTPNKKNQLNSSPLKGKNRIVATVATGRNRRRKVFNDKTSGLKEEKREDQKSGRQTTLKSRTLLLLKELENLKIQAKEEKIISSYRDSPTQGLEARLIEGL